MRDFANINRANDNVSSILSEICDFSEFTRRITANGNVWRISQNKSVDVCRSQCQVCMDSGRKPPKLELMMSIEISFSGSKLTKICGVKSINCYNAAEQRLFGEDVIDGLSDDTPAKSFRENCNCMPACTSISYEAEMSQTKFDYVSMFSKYGGRYNESFQMGMQPSVMTIRFKGKNVDALRRTEVYTFTNFLAICGGLLGLFLGISALSIVEFIYYATLRLFLIIRNSGNRVIPFKRRSNVALDTPNNNIPNV